MRTDELHVIKVSQSCPTLPLVEGVGWAKAIVWPGIGAQHRSIHRISLGPEAQTKEQRHYMEAVYYVMSGSATVIDTGDGTRQHTEKGAMILVEPKTPYVIAASGESVELVGGPCPPDLSLYEDLES